MKRKIVVLVGIIALMVATAFTDTFTSQFFAGGIPVPAHPQFPGKDSIGYDYLVKGDYLKSGLPVRRFFLSMSKPKDYLQRGGDNEGIPYQFNVIKAPNGAKIAAPNCLYCHAQEFEDSLIIGLGNSINDYSRSQESSMKLGAMAMKIISNKQEEEAAANLLKFAAAASPYMVTASKGVNIADRLTAVLAAHRDPKSFRWLGKPAIPIPEEVIPTDVPAWWLLKKKNGMFYTGFGRGDFPRFLMAANLLTVNDTSEAAEVLSHFHDVLAYLYSLEPPKYPKPINEALAQNGK